MIIAQVLQICKSPRFRDSQTERLPMDFFGYVCIMRFDLMSAVAAAQGDRGAVLAEPTSGSGVADSIEDQNVDYGQKEQDAFHKRGDRDSGRAGYAER